MRLTKVLMIMLLGLFLASCENRNANPPGNANRSSEDLRNETKSDLDRAKDNAKVEKEDYQNRVQAYLDKMDTRIDQLKDKAKNERGSVRVRTNRDVNRLEKERDAVKSRLSDLKSSSDESWKDIRSDLDKMMSGRHDVDVKHD